MRHSGHELFFIDDEYPDFDDFGPAPPRPGKCSGQTGDTISLATAEFTQMLDIITAVHLARKDSALPETVEAGYLAYSAASDTLDVRTLRKMEAAQSARSAARNLLHLLGRILPKLRSLDMADVLRKDLEAVSDKADQARAHDKASRSEYSEPGSPQKLSKYGDART